MNCHFSQWQGWKVRMELKSQLLQLLCLAKLIPTKYDLTMTPRKIMKLSDSFQNANIGSHQQFGPYSIWAFWPHCRGMNFSQKELKLLIATTSSNLAMNSGQFTSAYTLASKLFYNAEAYWQDACISKLLVVESLTDNLHWCSVIPSARYTANPTTPASWPKQPSSIRGLSMLGEELHSSCVYLICTHRATAANTPGMKPCQELREE